MDSPLSEREIEQLNGSSIGALPEDLRGLLQRAHTIAFDGETVLRFDMPTNDSLFPSALLLDRDDLGNSVVLDISGSKLHAGPVFYLSHDPPSLMIIAITFLDLIDAMLRCEDRSRETPVLSQTLEDKLMNLDQRGTGDVRSINVPKPKRKAFDKWLDALHAGSVVHDLRKASPGEGFSWENFGPEAVLCRFCDELIFAAAPRTDERAHIGNASPTARGPEGRTSDIVMPCIWFSGPSQNDRQAYSYAVISRRWHLGVTVNWPLQSDYIPGGILDSMGQYFDIVGLKGWRPQPEGLSGVLGGIAFYFRQLAIPFGLVVSRPVSLSFEEFRNRVGEITQGMTKDGMAPGGSVKEKLSKATSYRDLVEFAQWYQATDGGMVI